MVRQSQGRIFAAFPGPGRCTPPKIRLPSYFPNSKEKPKNRTIYRGKETRVARMINEPARISPWSLKFSVTVVGTPIKLTRARPGLDPTLDNPVGSPSVLL